MEPSGVLRTDGKRGYGATLIPWSAGKYMTWVLQRSTLVLLLYMYITKTAIFAGSAAEQTAVRKSAKYAFLPATHMFVPAAVETSGPINAESAEFLSSVSGD